ncbi:28S ribosomal protein S15, mitochondrial [Lutzomyia longipalpis]|uniref:28S ribosomal protein S15, mitochondrial n=1 Tax=Lutzomyia longipalpis TaxID=7200 RepID=UPI0024840F9B|nr:28S ribosomal protein S15, mitochondrial [Lutzomyia longipalpis]
MSFVRKILHLPGSFRLVVRHYAFKPEVPIKWVRPEKICCTRPERSGDMVGSPSVDVTLPVVEYEDCKLLETADEEVRKLFTLESFPAKKTAHYLRGNMKAEVQRHALDIGSMEARIADQTARIRRLQDIALQHPRNRKLKVFLKELIEKRTSYLGILRRWDYRRFEWLLDRLDLIYKPQPHEIPLVGRKYAIRKLTDKHCEDIREKKLTDYRQHLESQQIDFLKRKIENLQFILKEQEELKIPQTVTPEQIEETQKKLEEVQQRQAQKQ